MGRSMLVVAVLATACGRLAFDEQPGDAPGTDIPQGLACDRPGRFTLGATGLVGLVATPTASGFGVLAVHDPGVLGGWSFEVNAGELVAATAGKVLDPSTLPIFGAAPFDDGLLVAYLQGAETKLSVRARGLEARGSVQTVTAAIPADVPLATSPTGVVALATLDASSARIDARPVTTQTVGAPSLVADAADAPGAVAIARGARGFVLAYVAAAPSPNELRLVLLDDRLVTVAGPVVANATGFDPARPRVAWSPAADVYLVVWFEKNAANGDDVWWQLRDAELRPIGVAQQLATDAIDPQVTSDGTDFWVTWRDLSTVPRRLEAARVTAAGTVVPVALPASDGEPVQWSMTERAGQAVVAWAEAGGTDPDLWIVGLCP